MPKTYTITVVSEDKLLEKVGSTYGDAATHGGKTYTGFVKIEEGAFLGAYLGVVQGEEVIILEDEVAKFKVE